MNETTLIRKGNVMIIKPWVPDLDGSLSFTRIKKSTNWKKKYDFHLERLYTLTTGEDKQQFAITYAGMYQRVVKRLKTLGIKVINSDKRGPLPEPDYTRLQALRERQDEVIAAIASSHQGIIDCCTGFGKTYAIEQVVRIYPTQKIVITTPGKAVGNSIYRRVRAASPESKVSFCDGSHRFIEESDVIVCTSGSIHKIPVEWPDLLVFDEVHGAGGPGVHEKLSKFTSCRMIGLSASPDGRSDGSDKVVEALFGSIIYKAEYSESVVDGSVVPIEVRMCTVRGPEVSFYNDVVKYRNGYWRNAPRNRKIAEIARSFPEEQVQILASTVEHVLAIHQLLPEFQIVHSGIADDKWAEFVRQGLVDNSTKGELAVVDTDALEIRFEKGILRKAITTGVWKQGVDFPQLGVMIRADGMVGNIAATQISGRLSRLYPGKTKGILIDFMDEFGQSFIDRSHTRIEKYQKKKWRIINEWNPETQVKHS